MSEYEDEWVVDPLDYLEFDMECLRMDIVKCCYLVQQIRCLLKIYDR